MSCWLCTMDLVRVCCSHLVLVSQFLMEDQGHDLKARLTVQEALSHIVIPMAALELQLQQIQLLCYINQLLQINNDNNQVLAGTVANDQNHIAGIYNLINLYAVNVGAIFSAFFSVEGSLRCQTRWNPFIISLVISTTILVAIVRIYFQRFHLMRGRGQLPNSIARHWTWIAQRVVFVLLLMAFSVYLAFYCTTLLYPCHR